MKPIEKCFDCDRWKLTYMRSEHLSDRDLICSMCQGSVLLTEQNDMLEGSLVSIRGKTTIK